MSLRPTETQIHMGLVEWLILPVVSNRMRCRWWHTDNTHSCPARALQLKRMGMLAGVPDFTFIHHDTRPAFIELKRKDGRLTARQLDFMGWARDRAIPYLLIKSDDTTFVIHETETFLSKHGFLV